MPKNSLITIKEARKLLGSESNMLSDTQVQEIINSLQYISRKYLNISSSKNTLGVKLKYE